MRRAFVCFLEEIEDSKEAFRNYLTFSTEEDERKLIQTKKIPILYVLSNFERSLT